MEAAASADCTLTLVPAFGEFVAAGSPLLLVDGDRSRLPDDVVASIVLGLERTLDQDVAYGLRLLVDIAERSLSDSPFLDPTTAVQAIDRLHDCLRHLARRSSPTASTTITRQSSTDRPRHELGCLRASCLRRDPQAERAHPRSHDACAPHSRSYWTTHLASASKSYANR